jgi:prepilin-type N-terminal cleavage/methylation domain-containing protein
MVYTRVMKAGAFTIIELIIAVAIIGTLAAISIPQFGSFVRQQEFSTEVQKILSCVQTAQGRAAAPGEGSTYRYVGAFVTVTSDPGNMSCKVESFPGSIDATILNGDNPPMGDLITEVDAPSLHLGITTIDKLPSMDSPGVLRIYFDSMYHGQPMAGKMCSTENCINSTKTGVPLPSYSSNEFTLTLSDGNYSKVVTIPLLGVPIQVQ